MKKNIKIKDVITDVKPVKGEIINEASTIPPESNVDQVESKLPTYKTDEKMDQPDFITDSINTAIAILDDSMTVIDDKGTEQDEAVSDWKNNETPTETAKFFCCRCQQGFDKDEDMIFHRSECRLTDPKIEHSIKIECKNCKMQFSREAKLLFHQTKCKSTDDKKTENGGGGGGTRTIPDLIAIDKKLPAVLNVSSVNEEVIDQLQDAKVVEHDISASSPSDMTPAKKPRGRPKKTPGEPRKAPGKTHHTPGKTPVPITPNQPTPDPALSVGESLPPLPVRSMSARTSTSSRTSTTESPGPSRPKRSRKATDKPDL